MRGELEEEVKSEIVMRNRGGGDWMDRRGNG